MRRRKRITIQTMMALKMRFKMGSISRLRMLIMELMLASNKTSLMSPYLVASQPPLQSKARSSMHLECKLLTSYLIVQSNLIKQIP